MDLKSVLVKSKVGIYVLDVLKPLRTSLANDLWIKEEKKINKANREKKWIVYCGMCEQSNMGDMAQIYCSVEWIKRNYPDYEIIYCHASTFFAQGCDLINTLKKHVKPDDIFIMQCGYNTHDLGGRQDEMHQVIMTEFPDNYIIFLPQTVFFKSEDRKRKCSEIYNKHKRTFFLARDEVSLALAKEMFPNIHSELCPDIVTVLIGKYYKEYERSGICMCMRNDVEQFYDLKQRTELYNKLSQIDKVTITDTVITTSFRKVSSKIEYYVWNIIDQFSKYRVIVTDKYHGTIFALVSNTPVVLLRTTDHKLTSIYKWFHDIYPDRVFMAESIEEAIIRVDEILKTPNYNKLEDYFEKEYYSGLHQRIQNWKETVEENS